MHTLTITEMQYGGFTVDETSMSAGTEEDTTRTVKAVSSFREVVEFIDARLLVKNPAVPTTDEFCRLLQVVFGSGRPYGSKVEMIKLIRGVTGVSLKESKEAAEKYFTFD